MEKKGEEHALATTPCGTSRCPKMPFVLNNAGTIYQRMTQAHMRNQIGGNIQVYIDEIIITIKELGPDADTEDDNTGEPAQVAAANPIVNEEANNAVEEPEPAAHEDPSWREPLLRFLIDDTLPYD